MADKGTYDPAAGVRGFTNKTEDDDQAVSDHAGKASRQQTFALWLTLTGGHSAPLYGHFTGAPWMNIEETRIEVPFGGRVRDGGDWKEGEFVAVIKGKRLKLIYAHIAAGRRIDVHPCKDGGSDQPVVESVVVEAMPD